MFEVLEISGGLVKITSLLRKINKPTNPPQTIPCREIDGTSGFLKGVAALGLRTSSTRSRSFSQGHLRKAPQSVVSLVTMANFVVQHSRLSISAWGKSLLSCALKNYMA